MDIFNLKKQGLSNSAIAREMGIDVKTVRKYLRLGKDHKHGEKPKRNCLSKLDEYKYEISLLLAKEERFCEGRLSAVFIYNEMVRKGFDGSESLVRKYLQTIRRESIKRLVPIILTSPGEEAQVDWGEKLLPCPDGGRKKVYMFCMSLSHSGARFTMFTPRANRYYFLKGHIEAFLYFGGVPERLVYDQTRCAIDKPGFSRVEWNKMFYDFAQYYGFFPKACIPYRPRTKGRVENLVKYVKTNFLPLMTFESFEKLNNDARAWLSTVNNQVLERTGQRPSVLLNEERKVMNALPEKEYVLYELESRKVFCTSTISYKSRRYSVPPEYLGKMVTVKYFTDREEIEIYCGVKHLCSHKLSQAKYNILPEHAETISAIMRENLRIISRKKRQDSPDDDPCGINRPLSAYEEAYVQ